MFSECDFLTEAIVAERDESVAMYLSCAPAAAKLADDDAAAWPRGRAFW